MKRSLYFILSLLLINGAYGQVNRIIKPLSRSLPENFLSAPFINTLPAFDLAEAQRLDKEDASKGKEPGFSRSVYTSITLDNSGNWSELPNGDRIWRTQITSAGAQALIPYFDKFYLPYGSTLHVYTPDKQETIGAFTSANNPEDGLYSTGLIHGESCILEYYEPKEVKGQGILNINEVGHAYRWVNDYFPQNQRAYPTDSALKGGFNQSGPCEVNANCSEGDNWRNQQRSVVVIVIKGGSSQYLCSGSLINNVQKDCTPYILSAQHCANKSTAGQYKQYVFYFNYQLPNCNNPASMAGLTDDFVVGCSKIADSDDNGGETGSDFVLLRLIQNAPPAYNVYFAGWNNDATAPQSGVVIHHPSGDIKKISTYSTPAFSASYAGEVFNTHWSVLWAATTNGHGVTESGSSGSPLFNEDGLIVGHLTSGTSDCINTDQRDFFGKIHYDWTTDGDTVTRQLKPWLDPQNTGVLSIDGMNACNAVGIPTIASVINFRVIPNPSNGQVNLYFDTHEEKTITIYDALGRSVFATITSDIYSSMDLTRLGKGVYIVSAETPNEKATQKLIIE